jgi:peptide/nickel transport system substrate-binding protein
MCLRSRAGLKLAALMAAAAAALAATRPHYGGTLRVEVRESFATADPPQAGHTLAQLNGAFNIAQWAAASQAVYAADEDASGGRPFLDSVEVHMARPLSEQADALQLGKADIVELDPAEARRNSPAERKIWASSPVRLLALVFSPRIDDARVREGLSLAVDRSAIYRVLLQRQGEISGGLLPQWISGYAFLFPTAQDLPRARALVGSPRTLTFSAADPAHRRIADRIALDAHDAGLSLTRAVGSTADVRLVEVRIASADPWRALAALATALGLPEPPRNGPAEALYAAERALLEGCRVIPLAHLPDIYGVSPRVKGGPGLTPLGEWRFENLWLENVRP